MLLIDEPPSTFGQGQAGTLGGIAYGYAFQPDARLFCSGLEGF